MMMSKQQHFDLRGDAPTSTRIVLTNSGSTAAHATAAPVASHGRVAANARITKRAPGATAGLFAGAGRGSVALPGAGVAEPDR
jgi:hypothetical protein